MKKSFILLILLAVSGCSSVNGPISGKKYSSFAYDHVLTDNTKDIYSYEKYTYLEESYRNEARNFYLNTHPDISQPVKSAISEGKLVIGMSSDDVVASWGRPYDKKTLHEADDVKEEWLYGYIDYDKISLNRYNVIHDKKYVYFTDGIVTSWQD